MAVSDSMFFRYCGFTWNADLALPASVPGGVPVFHEVDVLGTQNVVFSLFHGYCTRRTVSCACPAQGAVPIQILRDDIVGVQWERGDHASEPPCDPSGCNESSGEAEGAETADKGHMPF